jgi:hypothetical protein
VIATVPAEACALGTAIRTLQTEPAMRILAAGLARYEVSGEKNYDFLNERRRILWAAVVHRIVNGEVSCAGFRDGSTTPDLISRYFLRSAVPNFEANTLTLGDVVYHGLWFFLAAPTAPSQESGPSLPLTGSPSQPQAQAAMPRRKGGRRPELRERIAQLMADDIAAGTTTLKKLRATKWENLGTDYGTSRPTAARALALVKRIVQNCSN